jgi:hypothetical protein
MLGPRLASLLDDEANDTLLTLTVASFSAKRSRPEPRLLVVESEALRNVIAHQDNLGYIKFIRLDRALFTHLYARFEKIYEQRPVRPSDGPATTPRIARRALSSKEALFVTLRYLAGSGNHSDLSVSAGVSQSTFARVTRGVVVTLVVVLRHWRKAAIRAPTNEEAEALARRISNRLPFLRYFIGFADGTQLFVVVVVFFHSRLIMHRCYQRD